MQQELDAIETALDIEILGVNAAGLESGNPEATNGRTLPWLQDVPKVDAWGSWSVTWRDVIVLDDENRRIGVYNLTEHPLGVAANYDSLKSFLIEAAQ